MPEAVANPAPGAVPGSAVGLLAGLIDFAGVFPPAALSLPAALAGYRAVRGSPSAWLVGPLLVKASHLAELAVLLREAVPGPLPTGPLPTGPLPAGAPPAGPLPVGVILDGLTPDGWSESLATALSRLRPWPPGARLVQVELPVPDGAEPTVLEAALAAAPLEGRPALYLEAAGGAPLADQARRLAGWAPMLADVAEVGLKVRTGGATPSAVPSPAALAGFLVACAVVAVPCKATAGLHHPYPHRDDATGAVQHGFLNLLAAASLAAAGTTAPGLAASLEAPDGPALRRAVGAHGPPAPPADARRLVRSFGSCSVAEPLEGLVELGLCHPDGTPTGEGPW